MIFRKILVAGGGVMGSQVSWQFATHGREVTVFDAFAAGLDRCREFHDRYGREFVDTRRMSAADVAKARARLSYSTDLSAAVRDADLIVEQVPEDLEIKRRFWQDASALASEKTIFATNTSSLLPSDMADFIDRPERFLTLHFCVPVWDANIGEIMGQPRTDPKYLALMADFAREVGLMPIMMKKEQPGYILNSILIPWLMAGVDLVRTGVSDPETVDTVWKICNRSEIGPCRMTDMVGMNVSYHILEEAVKSTGDERARWPII